MPEHAPAPTASRAVYGFALLLMMQLFKIIYITWAVVPLEWFESVGISCLPDKYWAVAVPLLLLTVFACSFIIYFSFGLLMTPNWNDANTVKDKFSIDCKSNDNISLNFLSCPCKVANNCKINFYKGCKIIESNIPILKELDVVEVSKELYWNSNK
ncbi:phosphatidylinositol N-acetylglucosaminyltransferase subunit P [Onthophagus taurus]|uniref:phosphatidylinositol N-acetylglucosaminyltransferase subunit P n=1 Tax=Onthophagus taurus TaxID=166361 RepID=UPI0039BE4B5F